MNRVVLGLLVLGLLAIPAAAQQCVTCDQASCTKSNGMIITVSQCPPDGTVSPPGKGVKNCRTMANCGGCIGYSCTIKDPITLAERPTSLVPAETSIRITPAAVALN